MTDPPKWVIHGERLVDDTPHVRVSLADVELPNHVRFTQYVFRMRRCAMTVVLDDAGERVLMMCRHRIIVDRWVWELPGGYVDDGEDSATAAAREVQEETGWRPRETELVMSSQPLIGNTDYPQDLYEVPRPITSRSGFPAAAAELLVGDPYPAAVHVLRRHLGSPLRRASARLRTMFAYIVREQVG